MAWCEANYVDYVLGLPKNERLKPEIAAQIGQAKKIYDQTGQPGRVFKDFQYRTLESWSRSRRLVDKANRVSPLIPVLKPLEKVSYS